MLDGLKKINAFHIDHDEKNVIAGNIGGEVLIIDIDTFEVRSKHKCHSSSIEAVAYHPKFDIFASLAVDRTITIWKKTGEYEFEQIQSIDSSLLHCPEDDHFMYPSQSTSQALSFHPTEKRLLTRSGNSSIIELTFDDDFINLERNFRPHKLLDVITVQYVPDTNYIISGDNSGVVCITENGVPIEKFICGAESVHWFEFHGDKVYIASDSRMCFIYDLKTKKLIEGDKFAKDDFEHITHDKVNNVLYATSFDRNVYRLNPTTANKEAIVNTFPFKLRWIKCIQREMGNILIVQCRNGSLIKYNIKEGRIEKTIKETPNAIWTAAKFNDLVVFAGENDEITTLNLNGLETKTHYLPELSKNGYIKRTMANDDYIAFGDTIGFLHLYGKDFEFFKTINVGSAVRDLDWLGKYIFVCMENGELLKVDHATGETVNSFKSKNNEPFWSLAINPEANVVAVGDRYGSVYIINADTFELVHEILYCVLPKRIKWLDGEHLIMIQSGVIKRFNLSTKRTMDLVESVDNTVEDFCWDMTQRYLMFIAYTRDVYLHDLWAGFGFNKVGDDFDYSKGIYFLGDEQFGDYSFITYGRTRVLKIFSVYDSKIYLNRKIDLQEKTAVAEKEQVAVSTAS